MRGTISSLILSFIAAAAAFSLAGPARLQLHARRCPPVVAAKLEKPALDELVAKLRTASPEAMRALLAANLKNIDASLFLRLAEMSDEETDDYEQLRIRTLASTLTTVLEAVVAAADKSMDSDASTVQALLQTIASPTGEFDLPVPPERLAALRSALRAQLDSLDEGFVGTVKAYMKKAVDDGQEGVVEVLRVLLQSYAAERFSARVRARAAADGTAGGTHTIIIDALAQPADAWAGLLRARLGADDAPCGASELLGTLQAQMAEVVLELPNGSGVQSLLAEFLNELMGAVRDISKGKE